MAIEPSTGVVFVAHAADPGMPFYNGKMFPQKYRGGIFDAEHGSRNRTTPTGARIVFIPVKADGTAGEAEVFAEGRLTRTGAYMGRPVDVRMLQDGSLLVSDDYAGAICRISCTGAKRHACERGGLIASALAVVSQASFAAIASRLAPLIVAQEQSRSLFSRAPLAAQPT